MKRLLLLSALVSLLAAAGCSDESVPPAPESAASAAWQPHDLPGVSNECLVGLNPGGEDLFVLAPRFFASVDRNGESSVMATLLDFPTTGALTFLNDDYFVYPINLGASLFHNSMSINWRTAPGGLPVSVQLPLVQLDPSVSSGARFAAGEMHRQLVVINDEGRMLVPVFDWTPNVADNTYLYVIRLSLQDPGSPSEIGVELERRIDWEYPPMWVMTDGSSFFASTVLETYRVGTDGSIAPLFPQGSYSVLAYDGRLYVNRFDGIHASADGGVTWEPIVYVGRGDLFVIDGRICVLRGSDILLVDEKSHSAVPLLYDGLPANRGGTLHSVARFGDNVYAATREGLYQIPLKDFFTPQPAR